MVIHGTDLPCFARQQFLNFFPLPHGQESFLPTRCLSDPVGSVNREAADRDGVVVRVVVGTSATFFPVSFSRANRSSPSGSPSSSLTRLRCSSCSDFSVLRHSANSGNLAPMIVQVC